MGAFRPPSQDRTMSRQDANAAFALSSFLYGSNAAYIEDIYARYEKDAASVDKEWQEFFGSLRDELVSALDGNWVQVEKVVGAKLQARAQEKAQEKPAELSPADVQQATRD